MAGRGFTTIKVHPEFDRRAHHGQGDQLTRRVQPQAPRSRRRISVGTCREATSVREATFGRTEPTTVCALRDGVDPRAARRPLGPPGNAVVTLSTWWLAFRLTLGQKEDAVPIDALVDVAVDVAVDAGLGSRCAVTPVSGRPLDPWTDGPSARSGTTTGGAARRPRRPRQSSAEGRLISPKALPPLRRPAAGSGLPPSPAVRRGRLSEASFARWQEQCPRVAAFIVGRVPRDARSLGLVRCVTTSPTRAKRLAKASSQHVRWPPQRRRELAGSASSGAGRSGRGVAAFRLDPRLPRPPPGRSAGCPPPSRRRRRRRR